MYSFKDVLFIYCDSVNNEKALRKAIELARYNQTKLTIAFTFTQRSVIDSLELSDQGISKFIDETEAERDNIIAKISGNTPIIKQYVLNDEYFDMIQLVNENGYDLVIKPSEDEGLAGKLFGSKDMGYLRQCPCPVWLVNPNDGQESQILVAAVDIKPDYPIHELAVRKRLNLDVLKSLNSLANIKKSTVKVVAVWYAENENTLRDSLFFHKEKTEVDTYVKDVEVKYKLSLNELMQEFEAYCQSEALELPKYDVVMLKGQPRKELTKYLSLVRAELVVMGTVARIGVPGFTLGNTAEGVLHQLNQSIFAIKPHGFESDTQYY
jgi:nucleotide-binding universal stress UspA family protein